MKLYYVPVKSCSIDSVAKRGYIYSCERGHVNDAFHLLT